MNAISATTAATIQAARSAGRTLTADRLETLLKYVAKDTVTPPAFEGYGVLSPAELPTARSHAAAGTLPGRPSPDLNDPPRGPSRPGRRPCDRMTES